MVILGHDHDLVTKGTIEPYHLINKPQNTGSDFAHDNADMRLTEMDEQIDW